MSVSNVKISSKKGFYVGDICYVLSRETYFGLWGKKYNFATGKFKDPITMMEFAVGYTAFGDNCYYGTNGKPFPVDSGSIGIVPLEMIKFITFEMKQLGYFVEVPGEASFEETDGVFKINLPSNEYFEINTNI